MIARLYLRVICLAAGLTLGAIGFLFARLSAQFAIGSHVSAWVPYAIGGVVGVLVWNLAFRSLQRSLHAHSMIPRSRLYKALTAIFLALGGAILLGGIMYFGTLVLGHMRPTWMEFRHTPGTALAGAALGLLCGLALAATDGSHQPASKR